MSSIVSTFYADLKRNSNSRTVSRNIHFEVKYLKNGLADYSDIIFLLTGLRIYTGEYKAQGPTLCPTEGRALRGPRALYSPV